MNSLLPSHSITVIDDDPVSLDFLTLHLAAAGYEAIVARDGQEVLDILKVGKSRIVISDWIMPGMDGAQLCAAIRRQTDLEYVYFIMLTVMTEKTRLVEAFKAGVDDFITKPFSEGEMLARLRAGIRMIHVQDELKRELLARQDLNAQLAAANEKLAQLVVTDELTRLPNRRYAMMRVAEEWALAGREEKPLSCAVVDVDHFKRLNDTHGHNAGDEVLRQVAHAIRTTVRDCDTICRIGGDEFLILFHDKDVHTALPVAQRCRQAVQSLQIGKAPTFIPVTISVGVAQREPDMVSSEELLQRADEALYAAKHAGRNTCCAGSPTAKADAP